MTPHRPGQLRADALAIWRAGVDAVGSERLVRQHVAVDGNWLRLGDHRLRLDQIERIAVVGGGKAGAGMAAGLEAALGPDVLRDKQLVGWINVPDDCAGQATQRIHLHGARPAGVNEPTLRGVLGTDRILQIVESLGPRDLCICLLSGGGSALMPAPIDGISLEDKLALTRFLSAAGADIRQLNSVRKPLSRIKGGGLLRACRAGQLVTLIISDVIGDPLDVIASGPTVADRSGPAEALSVLQHFAAGQAGIGRHVFERLEALPAAGPSLDHLAASNIIIGNNDSAVTAALSAARALGYAPLDQAVTADLYDGAADQVGRRLAELAYRLRAAGGRGPDCLVSGGEPVVTLNDPASAGKGGRNQQLILAALQWLRQQADFSRIGLSGLALLSGGTDGEDGPTDAAGAVIDQELADLMQQRALLPDEFLARNDAYHFFRPLNGLIFTGPTHTNVCDVRVAVVQ